MLSPALPQRDGFTLSEVEANINGNVEPDSYFSLRGISYLGDSINELIQIWRS